MRGRRPLLRDFQAGALLDLFLVSAVSSILAIRFYLHVTGYPQFGNESLHIAHVLWGGLFMLAAIVVLLSYVGRSGDRLGAMLGGVGFGSFIDEVGKFVTKDNDYFYEPTVAIIYAVFVLSYVAIRSIHRVAATPEEYVANALEEAQEIVAKDLDAKERGRALEYLARARELTPGREESEIARAIGAVLQRSATTSVSRDDIFVRSRNALYVRYRALAGLRVYSTALIVFFVMQLLVNLAYVAALVFGSDPPRGVPLGTIVFRTPGIDPGAIGFVDVAHLSSQLVSAAFVAYGVIQELRGRRITALRSFQRSILVAIFLTQLFAFYAESWQALFGLAFDVAVFLALRFAIERERAVLPGDDEPPAGS